MSRKPEKNLIVALDIGTSKVVAIVGEVNVNNEVDIIGIGSTIFGLLMVVAATDLATPILSRARYPGCIAAALALTPMYLILADVATALIRPPAPTLHFTSLVIAGIVNALAAAVIRPPSGNPHGNGLPKPDYACHV